MKNVSNEFKNIIKLGGPFYAYASITLKNGEKLYLDSENDFFISGNGYSEDGGDGFPLGSALSKSVTLVIDNINERFSEYDFYYAQISLFTEVDIENRSYDAWRDVNGEKILDVNGNTIILTKSRIERLNEGTYTVLEPTAVGDTIEIVGYDAMYKADVDFTSKLSYPTTAGQLLREVCSECGIMLGSPKFKNDDFVIEQAPEKVTCREVIGYIAMLAVGNAVIQNGTLVIKNYDFSAIAKIAKRADLVEDAGYSILMDYQSDPDISTDPVTITGIATTKKVEDESTILIRGTDDYALEITNPLIEGHEDDAINLIGDVLIGVKLRGFSGEFFPNPTIEFMDLACVVDRKDKVYPTFITSHEFNYLGSSSFSCGIKDPERQKSTYYSEATKVYEKANKEIKQNKTDFEAAVENLNKTLENASGMYSTEVVQSDGSVISYIHDKPTVEESKNVIKVTSEAIGISSDGGKTYPYGLFLTGDLITRILYAIGINADYINSGSLTVKDKSGNITFYADTETGRVTINAESISITGKSVEDISNDIVDDFVTNIYKTEMDEIKNSVMNKIETWYQSTDPSVNWGGTVEMAWCDVNGKSILDVNGNEIILLYEESKAEHEGDLWKDLSTNDEYIYRGGQWVKMQVPDEVFDEIDGKAQIFINTPVPPYRVGDLWLQGDKGDLMCCVVAKESGKYQSSDWGKATKYTDDSALNKFSKELNQSEIFNRLTNNGTEQGIFLRDGKIFINFSYAEGGTLKLGGKNNLYGELIMVDAEGKEVGRWNNGELSTSSAKILGGTINIDTGELNNAIKLNARNISLSLSPVKMVVKTDPINSGEYGYGNYSEIASNTIKMGRISNGSGNSAISNYTVLSPDGIKINDYKKGGHIYLEPISLGGYFDCDLTVTKNFSAQGTKNRIVNTENYASRLQYCYEMPSPMFGDIGEGYTDDTGVCIVAVDDIFRETVTNGANYHVFLQKEGPGDIWIENKTDSYFTVQGTKNMKFSWEIKAKQKGYEFERLECYKESENDEEYINYEDVGYYTYTKYVNDLELGGEEV